jgi:hypothetical protein
MSIRPVRTDLVAAILLQMSICHVRIEIWCSIPLTNEHYLRTNL